MDTKQFIFFSYLLAVLYLKLLFLTIFSVIYILKYLVAKSSTAKYLDKIVYSLIYLLIKKISKVMKNEVKVKEAKSKILSLILIVLIIGIFFRFYNIDKKVYWNDESYTSLMISGYTELVYLSIPILILVGYAIYIVCCQTPKQIWLFILILTLVTSIVLMGPGIILGGRRSSMARYLIPSYLLQC